MPHSAMFVLELGLILSLSYPHLNGLKYVGKAIDKASLDRVLFLNVKSPFPT